MAAKYKNLTFQIGEEQHQMLREICEAEERSQSFVLRKLIEAKHKELDPEEK